MGITYEDGHIIVDVDSALQKATHVLVMIDNICMENGVLDV